MYGIVNVMINAVMITFIEIFIYGYFESPIMNFDYA